MGKEHCGEESNYCDEDCEEEGESTLTLDCRKRHDAGVEWEFHRDLSGWDFCYVLILQWRTAFLTSSLQSSRTNITHMCLAGLVMKMLGMNNTHATQINI